MLERCKVVMEFHKYLVNSDGENGDADEMIYSLFIQKDKIEEDIEIRKIRDNRNHLKEVLSANELDSDDLSSITTADSQILWFSAITFGALDDIKESL
jgi:ATP-dependent 26S proteasome regulatory subunit